MTRSRQQVVDEAEIASVAGQSHEIRGLPPLPVFPTRPRNARIVF